MGQPTQTWFKMNAQKFNTLVRIVRLPTKVVIKIDSFIIIQTQFIDITPFDHLRGYHIKFAYQKVFTC